MSDSKAISAAVTTMFNAVEVIFDEMFNENEKRSFLVAFEDAFDHRKDGRSKRKKYDHERALFCIMKDCLGPEPLFDDGGFQLTFRVTKTRFERIHNDIMQSGNPFFF
jgi:hypothetical protein